MSKSNRVKRKYSVWEKKLRSLEHKYQIDRLNKSEFEKFKQELEEKEEKYYQLTVLKKKIELVSKKSKELEKQFKQKKSEFASRNEYKKAFKENKLKRQEIIHQLKAEYKKMKLAYCYEFETFSYKMKRWFFGMGKEFNRISWMSMKNVLISFSIVISITIFLSLIFLAIDQIFSLFI
ncbi:MAG: preprotein translocase subunit SecE [Ureaplasma sp.]|nr:preprotein translocase subunit SecE [Ureaplasma sp.]